MTKQERIEKLEAALRWALSEGALHSDWMGEMEFRDSGCGCCSGSVAPPEDLRLVIYETMLQTDEEHGHTD